MINAMKINIRSHWESRYADGFLPWDTRVTPPEVVDFWKSRRIDVGSHSNARALDLGCGTGTNVAYLAELGLHTIGVELSGNGLSIACERIAHLPLAQQARISLVQGSVGRLPLRKMDACYALDVGCFHAIPLEDRAGYAADVASNLSPGGYYQLYGFDWIDERADDPTKLPRGLRKTEVRDLFSSQMDVVQIIRAEANPHPCRWYLLQKR
jgi:SAM-dependent methyltransferase